MHPNDISSLLDSWQRFPARGKGDASQLIFLHVCRRRVANAECQRPISGQTRRRFGLIDKLDDGENIDGGIDGQIGDPSVFVLARISDRARSDGGCGRRGLADSASGRGW